MFDRMVRLRVLAVAWCLVIAGAAHASDKSPVANVPTDDEAMSAAVRKARGGVDQFLTVWANPPSGSRNFTVKVRIVGKVDGTTAIIEPLEPSNSPGEHFWLKLMGRNGDQLVGMLDNDPVTLKSVRRGDKITVDKAKIEDWMYLQDGKIVGNATACPALAHASEVNRRLVKERFGLACD